MASFSLPQSHLHSHIRGVFTPFCVRPKYRTTTSRPKRTPKISRPGRPDFILGFSKRVKRAVLMAKPELLSTT
jgi:hypothetical protein